MSKGTLIHQENQLSGKKQQQRKGYKKLLQGVPYHHNPCLIGASELMWFRKTSDEVRKLYRIF